jgi:MFS family permease
MLHLAMVLPIYFWITSERSALALIAGSACLGLASSIGAAAFYAAAAETLPKPIRGSTFSIVYSVAISTFGGSTQPLITWLIKVTSNNMAPAFYLFGASVVGMIARWLILESAPVKVLTLDDAP